jgi:hypothetical protein
MARDENLEKPDVDRDEQKFLNRRDFLTSLRKWSAAVIGVAVVGGVLLPEEVKAGWVNGRGGGGGGGGTAWANRGAAWANRGATWANRAGGGGSWVNRRGY